MKLDDVLASARSAGPGWSDERASRVLASAIARNERRLARGLHHRPLLEERRRLVARRGERLRERIDEPLLRRRRVALPAGRRPRRVDPRRFGIRGLGGLARGEQPAAVRGSA